MGTSLEEGLRGKDLDLGSLGVSDQRELELSRLADPEVLEVHPAGGHVAPALARDRVDVEVVLRNSDVVRHLGLDARSVARAAGVELGDAPGPGGRVRGSADPGER